MIHEVVAREVDEMQLALPRVHGSLVRTGQGTRVSRVTVNGAGFLQTAELDLGFPVAGMVGAADDSLALGLVLDLAGPTRWDGADVRVGQVFVYPPGTTHQANDSAGLRVGLVTADVDVLTESAHALGHSLTPHRKRVLEGPVAKQVIAAYRSFVIGKHHDGLLQTLVTALAEADSPRPGRRRTQSSLTITRRVLEFVMATDEWQPSMLSLCRAIGVSERRIQTAFCDIYDMTPSSFLRSRALSAARERLIDSAGHPADGVTRIAYEFGFFNLGRFAAYYREAYGELPSRTLRSSGR